MPAPPEGQFQAATHRPFHRWVVFQAQRDDLATFQRCLVPAANDERQVEPIIARRKADHAEFGRQHAGKRYRPLHLLQRNDVCPACGQVRERRANCSQLDRLESGSIADAEAAWRGAFLAHGSLTEPGRSSALEVSCPGPEAALALVGAARRLGVSAKAREVRGADRVVVRDGEAIGALLTRMGAQDTRLTWEERRMRREVRATANRLANFDDANLRRSARAAVAASARVERALEILGDDVPDHLAAAGQLRMAHRQASLEELGALADPPMTKDAIAGRIRRLLGLADRRARELGIPDTEAGLAADDELV